MAKSSARRSGCHIGAMLKPQPILRFFVTCARCTAHIRMLGRHLVALVLEMVLGQPQRVVAEPVHLLGDRLGLVEDAGELPSLAKRRSLAGVAFCP